MTNLNFSIDGLKNEEICYIAHLDLEVPNTPEHIAAAVHGNIFEDRANSLLHKNIYAPQAEEVVAERSKPILNKKGADRFIDPVGTVNLKKGKSQLYGELNTKFPEKYALNVFEFWRAENGSIRLVIDPAPLNHNTKIGEQVSFIGKTNGRFLFNGTLVAVVVGIKEVSKYNKQFGNVIRGYAY